MANSIEIIDNRQQFQTSVEHLRTSNESQLDSVERSLLLGLVGGGVLHLAQTAFSSLDIDEIYAKKYEREPEGRGAHFDVYGKFLRDDHQFIAVYNLAGTVGLRAALLPADLQRSYDARFPNPEDENVSEQAYSARRHFSSIALEYPQTRTAIGTLYPGTSMVLLQRESGPYVIHDITPDDPSEPGSFVKLIAPDPSNEAHEAITKVGYQSLDELITRGFKTVSSIDEEKEEVKEILNPPSTDKETSPRQAKAIVRTATKHVRNTNKRRCQGYD